MNLVGPSWLETYANNMVKQVNNVVHQWVYTMFVKFYFETLIDCNIVSVHLLFCVPDMCRVEHVARGWEGCPW